MLSRQWKVVPLSRRASDLNPHASRLPLTARLKLLGEWGPSDSAQAHCQVVRVLQNIPGQNSNERDRCASCHTSETLHDRVLLKRPANEAPICSAGHSRPQRHRCRGFEELHQNVFTNFAGLLTKRTRGVASCIIECSGSASVPRREHRCRQAPVRETDRTSGVEFLVFAFRSAAI